MAGIKLSLEGMPELEKALASMALHIRERIEKPAIEGAGKLILDAILAKAERHRDTGKMIGEIGSQMSTVGGKTSLVIRPAYRRVRYTHLVEFGTKPHGKHPGTRASGFFNTGVDLTQDAALERMTNEISLAIDDYWKAQGGGL